MENIRLHQPELQSFLQAQFGCTGWAFTLPDGSGNETYFAHSHERSYFVKLGAQIDRYEAMASLGLTPQVLAAGNLSDGTSLLVQHYIKGRTPARKDYHDHLGKFAETIRKTHHSPEVKQVLPDTPSDSYRQVGFAALTRLKQRWEHYRAQAPEVAQFVADSLTKLEQQIQCFQGSGLVASHNDICNANWLITTDGRLYLIDLDSMSLDDPAVDIGATLWWYYPPGMRQRFLEIAGYPNQDEFQLRMHVRMAMHCLSITLPREHSFDRFIPATFAPALTDFRAILAYAENPEGYEDDTSHP